MPYLFTSESVSEGHPDKVADQISDALLDEFLKQDPQSKVACETLVTTGLVVLSGEVKSEAYVDVQKVARDVIKRIGGAMIVEMRTAGKLHRRDTRIEKAALVTRAPFLGNELYRDARDKSGATKNVGPFAS